jgi:hypothetical protein
MNINTWHPFCLARFIWKCFPAFFYKGIFIMNFKLLATTSFFVATLASCGSTTSGSNEEAVTSKKNPALRTQSWSPDLKHVCLAEGQEGANKATQVKLLTQGGAVNPTDLINAYNEQVSNREVLPSVSGIISGAVATLYVSAACVASGVATAPVGGAFGIAACMYILAPGAGAAVGTTVATVLKGLSGAKEMKKDSSSIANSSASKQNNVVSESSYRAWKKAATKAEGDSGISCALTDAQVKALFE